MNSTDELARSIFLSTASVIICLASASPVFADDTLGTNMGIPSSSPPVLWPRGMSDDALNPLNLYPNGPQFGLGNTSGGFGSYGSGPISGVGLAQRSLPNLIKEELERPYAFIRRLAMFESGEIYRSGSLFASILTSRAASRAPSSPVFLEPVHNGTPYNPGLTDSILHDRPFSSDSILNSKF